MSFNTLCLARCIKQNRIAIALFLGFVSPAWAQTPLTSALAGQTAPTRSPFRAIASTQYTEHSETIGEVVGETLVQVNVPKMVSR